MAVLDTALVFGGHVASSSSRRRTGSTRFRFVTAFGSICVALVGCFRRCSSGGACLKEAGHAWNESARKAYTNKEPGYVATYPANSIESHVRYRNAFELRNYRLDSSSVLERVTGIYDDIVSEVSSAVGKTGAPTRGVTP